MTAKWLVIEDAGNKLSKVTYKFWRNDILAQFLLDLKVRTSDFTTDASLNGLIRHVYG